MKSIEQKIAELVAQKREKQLDNLAMMRALKTLIVNIISANISSATQKALKLGVLRVYSVLAEEPYNPEMLTSFTFAGIELELDDRIKKIEKELYGGDVND